MSSPARAAYLPSWAGKRNAFHCLSGLFYAAAIIAAGDALEPDPGGQA
jgi:hypothetical protein